MTVHRTMRIDRRADEQLRREAIKQDRSYNNLLNHIVKSYLRKRGHELKLPSAHQ